MATYDPTQIRNYIVRFYESKGLSRVAASGIAGNTQQESSDEPSAAGGGLFQDIGSRAPSGEGSAEHQLESAWAELQASPSLLASLQNSKTPREAARVFSEQFERPGTPELSNREKYAEEAYLAPRTRNASFEGTLEEIPGVKPLSEGLKTLGENDPLAEGLEKGLEDGPKALEEAHSVFSIAEELSHLLEVKNLVRMMEGLIGGILLLTALKTLGKGYGPSRVLISQTSQGQALAVRGVGKLRRAPPTKNSSSKPTNPKPVKPTLKAKAPTTTSTVSESSKPAKGTTTSKAAKAVKAAAEEPVK